MFFYVTTQWKKERTYRNRHNQFLDQNQNGDMRNANACARPAIFRNRAKRLGPPFGYSTLDWARTHHTVRVLCPMIGRMEVETVATPHIARLSHLRLPMDGLLASHLDAIRAAPAENATLRVHDMDGFSNEFSIGISKQAHAK